MKKAWLAGLLNLIPGLGYLYIDMKRAFGWWLLVASLLLIGGIVLNPMSYAPAADTPVVVWDLLATLGLFLYPVAFIVDAHRTAVSLQHS